VRRIFAAVALCAWLTTLTACAPPEELGADGTQIVVGFSQVGAESGWRTANTVSIHDAALDAGIKLRFSDAQGKQANQLAAIRSFIKQKVDVIAFSPVVESGWDDVLTEARQAGIPVILTDRAIDTKGNDLYTSFIGSDFVKEGTLVGEWLVKQHASRGGPVRVVELQGTTGSAPAKDRAAGFRAAIKSEPKFQIVASRTGDFTRPKGEAVMRAILKTQRDIDVVFAHNDDMGLGAAKALEAAGLRPGVDVQIVSIDAVRDGMKALAAGRFNFIAECSPLLGPQLMDLVKRIANGEPVPDRIVTQETTFTQEQAKDALPGRKY
jgi:galactofuranose transport system substrate-binding protein